MSGSDAEAGNSGCRVAIVDHDGSVSPGSCEDLVAWWSFTKTLIAACVLRLVEQRRLSLDDPLRGLPYTLRQLLQHRAGVGDYGALADYHAAVARADPPWSDDEVLRRIPADRLLFAPGAGWAYSNVGYLLLRREVERVEGEPLDRALERLVLGPLGLERCRLARTSDDMRCTAYPPAHAYDPAWVVHGCMLGSVSNAALALHRLLDGKLLAPGSRTALLDMFPIGGPVAGRPWRTAGYGLGVMMGSMQLRGRPDAVQVVGHSAGGPGSVGAVYRRGDTSTPCTVAVFTRGADPGVAEDVALRLLARA